MILRFHRLGSESLSEVPEIQYGQAPALAKERKVTVAQLGFARQFANSEKKGLTEKLLRDMLRRCEVAKFLVGVQHFALLIILESAEKEAFLNEMIENKWTLAEAKRQLRLRNKDRRRGGRRPGAPKDLAHFWIQLESRLTSLNRWRNVTLKLFEKSPELLSRAGVADALQLLDDIEGRSTNLLLAAGRAIKAARVSKKKQQKKKPQRQQGR